VGHTGPDVRPGLEITEEEAMRLLAVDVQECERCLEREITVELTQNMVNALASFVFNLGCGSLHRSTLRRKLNAGDYDAIPHEMRKWDKAGNHTLAGLTRRRNEEAEMFVA
jgi:lysozyme